MLHRRTLLSPDGYSLGMATVSTTAANASVKKRIEETGSIIAGNTPQQFAAPIAAEFEIDKKVDAAQKLKLE